MTDTDTPRPPLPALTKEQKKRARSYCETVMACRRPAVAVEPIWWLHSLLDQVEALEKKEEERRKDNMAASRMASRM